MLIQRNEEESRKEIERSREQAINLRIVYLAAVANQRRKKKTPSERPELVCDFDSDSFPVVMSNILTTTKELLRMFHFVDFRRRRNIGGQEGPGKLARASDGLSHSSSSCRPTVGSSSVPSRDTLTSRP